RRPRLARPPRRAARARVAGPPARRARAPGLDPALPRAVGADLRRSARGRRRGAARAGLVHAEHRRGVRLAILIGHFPPGAFGGAELQAEQWARRLAPRHEVVVITRRDPPTQPAQERRDGYDIRRLPVSPVPLLRTALDLEAIARAVAA